MIFWLVAGLMLIAALGFLLWPLLRGRHDGAVVSAEEVDVAIYRQRLAELDSQLENAEITAGQHRDALLELDRQLIADTAVADSNPPTTASDTRVGRKPLLAAGASLLLLPAVAVIAYLALGHEPPPSVGAGGQPAVGPEQIAAMVAGLENRLRQNPDDAEGWLMLGRSYAVLGRSEEAAKALENAYQYGGDNPVVLVEYARALASGGDAASLAGRPTELLEGALALDPDYPEALWLAGVAAVERGDLQAARARWQRLLQGMPADSENRQLVEQNLQALGEGNENLPAAAQSPAPPASKTGQPAALTVQVSLAEPLQDQVKPEDAVYIFARALDGPPMPLAVGRRTVADLPLTIILDDSSAMMPGATLSAHDQVKIVARVSRSGDAIAQPGDLQSKAKTVTVDSAEPQMLTIDRVLH